MYNGSGNGNSGYNRGTTYTTESNGAPQPGGFAIAGMRVKPLYLYIALAAVVVLALYVVVRFLNTSLVMHFSLAAGIMLLLANVRELMGMAYTQRGNTALLNVLIGAALVCAWLSQIVGALFWLPAVLLLAIAVPLVIGRSGVYAVYTQTARNAVSSVRRVVGR